MAGIACAPAASKTPRNSAIAAQNNVVYLAPAAEGWQGLPLGNGTFGAQVWQPDGLTFQFGTPMSGVMGGSLGRLHVRTTPGMMAGSTGYRQTLALDTATLNTEIPAAQGTLKVTTFTPAQTDGLVVQLSDGRPDATASIELEAWRPTASRISRDGVMVVTDTLGGKYRYAMAAGVIGAPVQSGPEGKDTVSLVTRGKASTVFVAFAGSMDAGADVEGQARAKLAEMQRVGVPELTRLHQQWWEKFWSKSHLHLASSDGEANYVANLWYLHQYAMAAGSRGEVPPKFNGGLWTTDRDTREWGEAFWHWNTQETVWPLYAANHLDLLAPYYSMYSSMLPRVEQQTKDYFGVDGAHYEETMTFDGSWNTGKGEKEMGVHPRLPVPKKFAFTNMVLSTGAEIGMQFWWNYLYTGDQTFLREKTYPLMRSVARFYVHYLEKDAAGRYIIYPANSHENFWKVQNPTPDLAAIRYLFPALIEASRILNLDAAERAVWQDRLDHLAPYPISEKTKGIAAFEPRPGEIVEGRNNENPELQPVGIFPLITLATADAALGKTTFSGRYFRGAAGWNTDALCAARLGLAEEMAEHLVLHAQSFQHQPSGMMDYANRKKPLQPYLEASGVMATATGEMLLQSFPVTPGGQPVIRICPALPPQWDADFNLLAMGGFEVQAQARKGAVAAVTITSTRGGRMALANPFTGEAAVMQGAKTLLKSKEPILQVNTVPGAVYRILSTSQPAPPMTVLAPVENLLPKKLRNGSNWIGREAPLMQ